MARLSKTCPVCKQRRPVELQLLVVGDQYAFQAECTHCGTMIGPDGPPLRTAEEVARWVAENRHRQP